MFPASRTRLLLPLTAAVALAGPAAVAHAGVSVVASASSAPAPRIVQFELAGVRPQAIVGATVVQGSKRRRLAVANVRRGASRGVLRVRVPSRRSKPRLVLRLDTSAPATKVRRRARRNGGRKVSVSFTSNERASFTCRVNDEAWRACRSTAVFSAARQGKTKVQIRAKDRAGNVEPTPVVVEFPPVSPQPQPAPAPTPTPEPTNTPSSPAAPVGGATTQGLGFQPLADDVAAARVVRSPFEPRPENTPYNQRVPTASELATYYAARTNANDHFCQSKLDQKVTGNFRGTTDEILQWGAWKWGLDVDMLRSVAVVESWWKQSAGDHTGGGLMSIVWEHHKGTFPLGKESTAFNVDYFGAIMRFYYEGCGTWLNDVPHGSEYAAGDIWGSIGTWYAGRWHTADAEWYINRIKTDLANRTWAGQF